MDDPRGYTFWGTCKGTTKAATPCKRIVVYANGYCRAHGGDSTEFMRERFAKIKAKALRSHARWMLLRGGKCKFHGGASTGPKTPEGRIRALAALRAGWLRWRERTP